MGNKRNLIWLLFLFMAMFTLAACVRPYPQPEATAVPEPDPNLIMTQPAIQPEQPLPTPIGEESMPVATPLPVEPTQVIPPTAEPPQDQIHTVQPGDTLFAIASQYGATIDSIVTANNIVNVNQLEVGQQLIIPAPGSVVSTPTAESADGESPVPPVEVTADSPPAGSGTHVVQSGENLYRIGLKYGCSVDQMMTANGIVNPNYLDVGQVLQIPDCS